MESLETCPHCGKKTPEENLRCIYCGERLPVRGGLLGSFRFGAARLLFAGLVLLLLFLFLRLWVF